jgi:hypothetical protein
MHFEIRHQGGQPGDEVERLEDDLRPAIAGRRLELVAVSFSGYAFS